MKGVLNVGGMQVTKVTRQMKAYEQGTANTQDIPLKTQELLQEKSKMNSPANT